MGEFVKQDGIEFALTEQEIKTDGQQNARTKNSTDGGSLAPAIEDHGDTIKKEPIRRISGDEAGLRLSFAAFCVKAKYESRQHRECPCDPNRGEHCSCSAL